MKETDYNIALRTLHDYIEKNNCRKTPERETVLKTVYSFSRRFTFDDLEEKLSQATSFPICRSTVYNALRLFQKLGLMRCVRMDSRSYYDIILSRNACVQVCRVCGKTTFLDTQSAEEAIGNIKLKRFSRESLRITIDGICASCKAKLTKAENKKKNKSTI